MPQHHSTLRPTTKTSFPHEGVLVALPIPTDARGGVMKRALAAHLAWLCAGGIHGVLAVGSTGEFVRFTVEGRKAILEPVAELAAPLPILAIISDIRPRVVAELGCFARRLKFPLTRMNRHYQWAGILYVLATTAVGVLDTKAIDRHALVARHNIVLTKLDPENPLQVGNGEFAFTADVTGLQTFAEAYEKTIPLGTLSQWGWHTSPNPNGWSIDRFPFKEFDVFGQKVGYADVPGKQGTPESDWLRSNPHRLHLGRIGFQLTKSDGSPATTNDLADIEQTLNLWDGVLVSHFKFDGQPVDVETVCHPSSDLLAVRVRSPLLIRGQLGIQIHFPYGTGATSTTDWSKPEAHETLFQQDKSNVGEFTRKLDNDRYWVDAKWTSGAKLTEVAKHKFVLTPAKDADVLELVCAFMPKPEKIALPSFDQTRAATREHWNNFWSTGGAIDLSGSKDPRWRELERRIVLSQYLTAIQCAGSTPPQETGLAYNTWFGKFHLEMHWWHAAHFALWGRLPLLERSLGYYRSILPRAQGTAKRQGYAGARWPKMTDPSGAESPSPVGPFLIWQQPHPIFYAELCYRTHGDRATLDKYKEMVFETAEFMASYPAWDEAKKWYVLGPVLQSAQEIFPKDHTLNPTFKLTYWRWGLETAQQWRERLGLPRFQTPTPIREFKRGVQRVVF